MFRVGYTEGREHWGRRIAEHNLFPTRGFVRAWTKDPHHLIPLGILGQSIPVELEKRNYLLWIDENDI